MVQSIAIVGLGYVGLPLAITFIKKGITVLGIDLDVNKLECLRAGRSYLPDISDETVNWATEQQHLIVTNDYTAVQKIEAVIICVPTPLDQDHNPDLRYLEQVGRSLSPQLSHGQLIVLESSTYPGTTREVLMPLLEQEGRKVGTDIFLAYSPERIDPGNKQYPLEAIPKVISGVTEQCLQRIFNLYSKVFNKLIQVSSTEAAEMSKLLENSYRFINISFINEFAMICEKMNINVWEVIEAARTKPYGYSAFYPGPGIGGHCIPVDPLYLQWRSKQFGLTSRFIEFAQLINLAMPRYIIDQVKACLSVPSLVNTNILVVGIAYKRDIGDTRESSAIEMLKLLLEEEATLTYHDPHVAEVQIGGHAMTSVELSEQNLKAMDCVLLATNHTELPIQFVLDHSAFVFDTRNMTEGYKGKARIVRLGEGYKENRKEIAE
jgi:UDP-N-acetyl-D-glucosamine dehydrogenase